jgi:hypothetical protein
VSKPKISTPQDIPSVFADAAGEANWLIFAVGEADENGKRPKRPVARDKPYIWVNRDKAASFTLSEALGRLRDFADWPGGLDAINRKAEERRQDQIANDKKPGPEIRVEEYVLGYFAREDSALVALDFDNVAQDGVILDFELAALIEESEAYVEFSSSGTGVRVFMPRGWGDDSYHAGEKNDVGFFVSSKGAACALTFNKIRDGQDRDDALFDLVINRHGGADRHDEVDSGDVSDQVLEHGRVEVETFREILGNVQNDERFDDFNEWLAMVRGAKEYYEIVDPDRLDEVRELVEGWCKSWQGGSHDADKFEDVWGRPARKGSKAGLGSWVHYAQQAGWDWEAVEDEEPVDEWAFLERLDTEDVGTGKKKVKRAIANFTNATRVVEHMPAIKGFIGRNVITGTFVRLRDWDTGEVLEYPQEWTDPDMYRVLLTVQGARKGGHAIFAHFHIDHIRRAMEAAARPVQPVHHMISRLPKWDGKPRIDTWLSDYFGVEDTPLHRAYARKFMVALMARGHATVQRPVKVDTVLAITGRQGMNKSQFFETLAGEGDLFTDHVGEISRKEAPENIAGRWIVELSEGEIVTKADHRALKGFLARSVDKFRPSYGRNVQTFARACVFVMPTNDDEILNDPTGSRRYWPVAAKYKAPLSRLRVERRQILAEAREAYNRGELWWLTDEEDAQREKGASDFEIQDPFEPLLEPILEDVIDGQIVTQSELLGALGIDVVKGGNDRGARRVRDILKKWGWERARSGGKRGYRRSVTGSLPEVSDEAKKARKEGRVIPLAVSSEFSKIE